ncbi:hypothetical protein [Streptomyces xanthii]|uniref:Uncharacterized protein n=1 Tax=Streptomyces xanthii TaxID=2768069 RepID=A0A7H1BH42_9ACTN|nr:hypothetical protein [Streptomyces xanthii]QNS08047.1 hypothetical protein IAG42_33505 [Streptomyces xanthii]
MRRIVSAESVAPPPPAAAGGSEGAPGGACSDTPIYDALLAEWKQERKHAPGGAAPGGLGRPQRTASAASLSPAPAPYVPQRRAAS